jgi:hypothetical protein
MPPRAAHEREMLSTGCETGFAMTMGVIFAVNA